MSDEPKQPERAQQTDNQFRIALLTASAALGGAVVGALATFAGVVYQADSTREQALRQERQVAYTQLNVAFDRFNTAQKDDRCARYDELLPAYATVRLLAPSIVAAHAGLAVEAARRQCLAISSTGQGFSEDQNKLIRDIVRPFTEAARKDLGVHPED
ncbi:hypothetical protein [Nonomuraea sp. SYSU D8015]|uniref:hypothetical protein n=1 Tax=Nonomuraea sp. SYSU D8015 TaxID=2593644 RepID=UPI001660CA5B|nr:hypothetical protein [Nonomuraea sp. SYSU D8015]